MKKKYPLGYSLYRILWAGIDLLFPPVCGGCGAPPVRWCSDCQKTISLIPSPKCDICGLPQPQKGICASCRAERPAYHALRSWLVFEGPIRKALHRMKYRHDLGLGDALASHLLPFLQTLNWKIDLVLPVPLGKKRFQERGYNQVGLVARPLALAQGWDYAPRALKRSRETVSQVGLSASKRQVNVRGAFTADERRLRDKTILIMDDVATTGATLAACAESLLDGGAREVYALTLARALPHHGLTTV